MTIFDYAVLAIIGVSILISLMRGLVREILGLATWIFAFWVAQRYAYLAVPWMPAAITEPNLRFILALIVIFIAVWIIGGLISWLIATVVSGLGLGIVDRLLGVLFGVIRGVVICVTFVLLAGMTAIPKEPVWREARFSPILEKIAMQVMPWLPANLQKRIRFV